MCLGCGGDEAQRPVHTRQVPYPHALYGQAAPFRGGWRSSILTPRALLSSVAPQGSSSSASLHGFNIRALLGIETSGSASAGAWLGEVLIPVTVTECVLGQAPWYASGVNGVLLVGAGLLCTILTQGLYTCLLLPSCLVIPSCCSLNWPFSTPCFQYHIENILDSLPGSTPVPVPSQSLSQPTLPMGYQHSTDAKL